MKRREFITQSLRQGLSISSLSYLGACSHFGFSGGQKKLSLTLPEQTTGRFSHRFLIEMAKQYGTPLYLYDADHITKQFQKFKNGVQDQTVKTEICYAIKANNNINIIKLLGDMGAGAECISINEVRMAIESKISPRKIIYTSNSKSLAQLKYALSKGVIINLDSMGDLDNLIAVVEQEKKRARISFRINPDITSKTHKYIATGHKFSKFGILVHNQEYLQAFKIAKEHPLLEIEGIHSHIGSQILETNPFIQNARLVSSVAVNLYKELGVKLKFINLGGGLGIPYRDGERELPPGLIGREMHRIIKEQFKDHYQWPELWLEPGRYFVGASGFLLSTVNSVKLTDHKNFINVNTGFNHLVRPTMYQAYHRARVLAGNGKPNKFDIAGNICETGDILGKSRILPTPKNGDIMAFLDAGAYGYSMSSEYNSFFLPPELLIRGESIKVIRKRSNYRDLLRNQAPV
jgi:diaminopimelate decarboxylase